MLIFGSFEPCCAYKHNAYKEGMFGFLNLLFIDRTKNFLIIDNTNSLY